jgi:hypothetical protein
MKKACINVGEVIWTMTYIDHEDGTLTIENFDKEDNDGYMFHKTLPVLESIQEIDDRVADKVTIDGKTFDVRNKENVFTYKKPL